MALAIPVEEVIVELIIESSFYVLGQPLFRGDKKLRPVKLIIQFLKFLLRDIAAHTGRREPFLFLITLFQRFITPALGRRDVNFMQESAGFYGFYLFHADVLVYYVGGFYLQLDFAIGGELDQQILLIHFDELVLVFEGINLVRDDV